MPNPDNTGNPLPKPRARKRKAPAAARVSALPPSISIERTPTAPPGVMGNLAAQFVELFTANKWLRWTVFWLGWFWISPTTIIPGAIAVGVGNVFYKERAVNLVTVCAAYLGICLYLLLGHMVNDWPEQVRLWMGFGMIFSLVVLGMRYPMFGLFMLLTISAAFRGGRRSRRW
jgi:hypothetical protein